MVIYLIIYFVYNIKYLISHEYICFQKDLNNLSSLLASWKTTFKVTEKRKLLQSKVMS